MVESQQLPPLCPTVSVDDTSLLKSQQHQESFGGAPILSPEFIGGDLLSPSIQDKIISETASQSVTEQTEEVHLPAQTTRNVPLKEMDERVLNGYSWYLYQENIVYITHIDDAYPWGGLKHFASKRENVIPTKEDQVYRSGHAQVFKMVTGHWPDEFSHQSWFGWARQNGEIQLFSCTLNTPDGYSVERAADQRKKKDLKDLISRDNFDKLVTSLELESKAKNHYGRDSRREIEKMREVYARLTASGDTRDILELKKFAKLNLRFHTGMDTQTQLLYCRLFDAVQNEKFGDVEELVKRVPKINDRNLAGDNVLLHSVKYVDGVGCAKKLLTLGADPNVKDEEGNTATVIAAKKGDLTVLEILVKEGADLNVMSNDGWLPTIYYVQKPDRMDILEFFVREGVDVNLKGPLGEFTPVMWAVREENLPVLELLVREGGADVNLQDYTGQTASMLAAQYGNVAALELLLEAGADLTIQNSMGYSTMTYAASAWSEGVRTLLNESLSLQNPIQKNSGPRPIHYQRLFTLN